MVGPLALPTGPPGPPGLYILIYHLFVRIWSCCVVCVYLGVGEFLIFSKAVGQKQPSLKRGGWIFFNGGTRK